MAMLFLLWRRNRLGRGAVLVVGANLLVTLFLLSGAFLIGETWLRFFHDTTDSFGYLRTCTRWFKKHFHLNNMGFRDDQPYEVEIPAGRRRISFVGDSFAIGHGIEDVADRFTDRIRKARPQWQIHNLSWIGVETDKQLDLLRHALATGYQLDTVVLVYCLNDVSDLIPGLKDQLKRIAKGARARNAFCRHSYLLEFLYFRWRIRREGLADDYFGQVIAGYQGEVWQKQQARLLELRRLVQTGGGRLLVVTFPFMHELGPDSRFREVHRQLDEFWTAHHVPHLDLLPVLQAARRENLTVSRFDAHPNERAHELAAQAILPFLDEHIQARTDPSSAGV